MRLLIYFILSLIFVSCGHSPVLNNVSYSVASSGILKNTRASFPILLTDIVQPRVEFEIKYSTKELFIIHTGHLLNATLKKEENKVDAFAKQLSDLEAQGSDLAEENFYLRSKLDLPPTDLDLSNFKKVKAVELEKLKSLNFTLQSEIDKMEEERLALKSQLRLRALEVSLFYNF